MSKEEAPSKFAVTIKEITTKYSHAIANNERHEPEWHIEYLIPHPGRRNEQLFLDTRRSLCSLHGFQEDIKRGQESISSGRDGEYVAEKICETWKVTEGREWVQWLLETWDLSKSPFPHLSSDAPSESFPPWLLQLDYLKEREQSSFTCRVATITLHAGISRGDARKLIRYVFSKFPTEKKKGGRPKLSDIERNSILNEFTKLGIPNRAKRRTMIRKVQHALVSKGFRPISETAIGNELRKWLIEHGETVRHYSK